PLWYYLPVTLLGLLPWTVFVIAAAVGTIRAWWLRGKPRRRCDDALRVFLLIWLVVPVIFFSFSQSKLSGYIVPAIPAGALLVVEYVRRHIADGQPVPQWLLVVHSLVEALLIIPARMLPDLLLTHRSPWGIAPVCA